MGRLALRVAAALLLLAAAFSGWLWVGLRDLPFNEHGRYFDLSAGVVHHEHSATVYGVLAIMLAMLGLTLLFTTVRKV